VPLEHFFQDEKPSIKSFAKHKCPYIGGEKKKRIEVLSVMIAQYTHTVTRSEARFKKHIPFNGE